MQINKPKNPVNAIIVNGLNLYFLSKNNEIEKTITAIILILSRFPLRVVLPKNAIKIIEEADDAIRPIEVERRPFKIFAISSISLCFLKKLNKKIEIITPVITQAKVAIIAPMIPATLRPTKSS